MEHFFELPVLYNGQELNFNGRLVTFGYTYKFHIVINGQELIFEKDDEQNYRMLETDNQMTLSMETGLIEAVIHALQSLAEA